MSIVEKIRAADGSLPPHGTYESDVMQVAVLALSGGSRHAIDVSVKEGRRWVLARSVHLGRHGEMWRISNDSHLRDGEDFTDWREAVIASLS